VDVAGRVALVTGGGTGLGRATALELAGAGVSVAVNYLRSQGSAEAVVQQVVKSGGRALAVQADISEPSSVGAMINQVESGLGPIDILVNNAGTTHYLPAADLAGVTAEHRAAAMSLWFRQSWTTNSAPAVARISRSIDQSQAGD